jgi:flagellar biosynthesis protein FlhB
VKAQKSKDSSVRFTCLVLLYHLWFVHGPSFLSTLSDSLQVFTELLDDYDHDVEHLTSSIIKLIEKLTGETLQSRLGI